MGSLDVLYRLMNDYGADWPFWQDDGLSPTDTPALPPDVSDAALAWAAEFQAHYSYESGWPTEAAARKHERQGRNLLKLVERTLTLEDSVQLDYWETNWRKGL